MYWMLVKAFFGNVWKKISFLFVPPLLYWVLGVVAVVGMYEYHKHEVKVAYENGYKQGRADEAAVQKKQREAEQARAAKINQQQADAQALVVKDLNARLAAAEAKKAQVITVTKEVTKYVSQAADSRAPIPAGFVYVHDLSTATDPDKMAGSKPSDVDAPTSIKLSDIARVDAANNAECQLRGEIIDSWIDWYNDNKALWEKAVKAQSEPIPTQ